MIKGVQSIAFKEQPYIIESASVVGKKKEKDRWERCSM